ncbi:RbsD or FucU transport [Cellulosimicrobium cellulans]|uniref:RbsD or FucU transport n=1 Tax=Cellulosimicrobium cellulans TaxID=1710 RepID=A0A1Y0I0N8_CELCE|nr:RbsD/FucU domain-containing protein [Cellulosimicrobium cellulans]ARU53779.1 RbsD or FucU transport [Cellulosimicrobium cellulans]
MLRYPLLHPGLIGALAGAGHGSRVLLADANYPHSTGVRAEAQRVHLNLRPGLVTVDQVLEVLLDAVPVESAAVMVPSGGEGDVLARGAKVPAHAGYRAALAAAAPSAAWRGLDRFAFYDAARGDDVALLVATGDERAYANVMLTVGVRQG